MKYIKNLWMAVVAGLISLSSNADDHPFLEQLAVQSPAEYETPEAVPEKVLAECTDLAKNLSEGVIRKLESERYAQIRRVRGIRSAPDGKLLSLSVISIKATPGGAWTGAKSMSVRASLYQNDELINWSVFTRRSKSQLNGYGNCNILERDAQAIAIDVHRWLVKSQHSHTLPATLTGVNRFQARRNISVNRGEINGDQVEGSAATEVQPNGMSDRLFINEKATYESPGEIPLKIFNECHLDVTMGAHMLTIFSQRVRNVMPLSEQREQKGMELQYEIVGADGNPGSVATGRKTLAIRVKLLRDGEMIDSFEDIYISKKPLLPVVIDPQQLYRYGGTCDALNAGAKVLASHTFKWYVSGNKIRKAMSKHQ